jgi:2-hydroxycyclohexanecarboxyl-CoA dehydrogenase
MEGLTLSGRVALVTGGAGGIGSAIVRDLAAIGAKVVICDLNEAAAKQLAADVPDAVALPVDLSQPTSVDELAIRIADEVGKVDVLVSNAGWDKVGPFLQSDPDVWDRLLHINLRAPIQLTHRLLGAMVEQHWGRIVYISSDAARVGSTGEAVYSACKAGLIGFSKTIAREAARGGVTSNVVCPGPSDTPLLQEVAGDNPKLVESLKRAIPIGRIGQPDDVSGLVAFLCSERAEFITGQTISVSGGLTMA